MYHWVRMGEEYRGSGWREVKLHPTTPLPLTSQFPQEMQPSLAFLTFACPPSPHIPKSLAPACRSPGSVLLQARKTERLLLSALGSCQRVKFPLGPHDSLHWMLFPSAGKTHQPHRRRCPYLSPRPAAWRWVCWYRKERHSYTGAVIPSHISLSAPTCCFTPQAQCFSPPHIPGKLGFVHRGKSNILNSSYKTISEPQP